MSKSGPELVVLVLQWGRVDETIQCLEALRASRGVRLEVVVIDNASPEPDAIARVRESHPWVQIVANERNLGFAEGNNVVLRRLVARRREQSGPRYCMLLNNDVRVDRDCLARLLEVARGYLAGAVGAINYAPGRRTIVSSGGHLAWPACTYRDAGAAATALDVEAYEVQTVCGSTMLLDLDALASVGVLDPDYFCVYEETDLCMRLLKAGHRIWLVPRAHAVHKVGASTPRALHMYFRFRNRIRFVRKHHGRRGVLRMMPALLIELGWRLPVYVALLRLDSVRAILRGVWDAARGRTGRGSLLAREA